MTGIPLKPARHLLSETKPFFSSHKPSEIREAVTRAMPAKDVPRTAPAAAAAFPIKAYTMARSRII